MDCTSPKKAGFLSDGKTLTFSSNKASKEFASFEIPCRKCINCRLSYAREWSIRAMHEAQMHPENSFITLTYETLDSPKLQYSDWQEFAKKLRRSQNQKIPILVCGEYGEKNKRPHWHAILFNFKPKDGVAIRSSGEETAYSSKFLTDLWGKGITEFGSVTQKSANYVARYAAKKLVHGQDDDHDYHPIFRASSKYAIGKSWLEKYYEDIFNQGELILPGGTRTSIPRYYEKWLKANHPQKWTDYVTLRKAILISKMAEKEKKQKEKEFEENMSRQTQEGSVITRNQVRAKITNQRFSVRIQKYLKL